MSKRNKSQKGGKNVLPSEYFGKNSGRYFENNSDYLNIPDSAYGKSYPVSHGINIGNNMVGPDLGASAQHSSVQTGGVNPFHYIVNPETGRKVSLFGKTGQKVLNNYIKKF